MMMNFLDLSASSEEERRLIREILSDTSVVKIAEPLQTSQLVVSKRQSFKNSSQHMNFSNNANNGHSNSNHLGSSATANTVSTTTVTTTTTTATTTTTTSSSTTSSANTTLNHRGNYNNQRKNIHNNNNNSNNNCSSTSSSNNSLANNSGNNNRNARLSSLNNAAGGINNVQQQQYPQQYTSPLPSSASSSTHYHNININNNINSHSANSLNSQLSQQHQRTTNEHSNERHRGGMNIPVNTNNDINIVSTSASGFATMAPSLEQHHANTVPQNVYNHHTAHMHHQVPPVMSTAKLDPKSSNLKNQAYHSQDTSNSMQNTTGVQPVPPMAGDINSVIGMDLASSQSTGYAIPSHVTAFGPPPHVYGGPPIFHSYPYLIPYNIPYPHIPYVLPPNSVVPPRQQVPPQSNQQPNASSTSSPHSRHLAQQHQNHKYRNVGSGQTNLQSNRDEKATPKEPTPPHQNHNAKKSNNEKELPLESHKSLSVDELQNDTSNMPNENSSSAYKSEKNSKKIQEPEFLSELDATPIAVIRASPQESGIAGSEKSSKVVSTIKVSNNALKNGSSTATKNKNVVPNSRGNRTENQVQNENDINTSHLNPTKMQLSTRGIQIETNRDSLKAQDVRIPSLTTNTANSEDMVKETSDEGLSSQTDQEVSKQSPESSKFTNEQSKSFTENCNKIELEKSPRESNGSIDLKNNEVPHRTGCAWVAASSKSWADLFKRSGSNLLGPSVNGETEHNISGSENSDEENKIQRSTSNKIEGTLKSNSLSTLKEHRSQEAARRASDKMAPRLAQKINSINLKHSLPFLKPRGFINKGNGCYINATLQALIACPPFYNLMKEIGDLRCFRRENSCTPILDSFAEFFLNFPPLDANKKNKQQSTSQDQKLHINYLQAEAIEPKCIYNVLGQIKSECLKGAQEDAEEFLSSVLNGLHEEMIGLVDLVQESSTHNGHPSDIEDSNDDVANDDNLWREVGPKNRSLPIRTAKVINTPIQEIFGGSLFSIRTAGKDRCGHRSPFFDLQLDISGDNVKSVQDAIKSFTATEIIHDFYCSKTKQKLDAQRRTSLDQLPPILILHLKQFVYSQDHGLRKLIKKIEYPIDFELPENCLHEKNNDRNLVTSRSYKLLAVVYHDGKEAVKGHYLTDVYHIGSSQWIRCDDSNLKVVSSPRIDNPDSSRTPYLLFYRRLNTLRAQTGNHDNKKKN